MGAILSVLLIAAAFVAGVFLSEKVKPMILALLSKITGGGNKPSN